MRARVSLLLIVALLVCGLAVLAPQGGPAGGPKPAPAEPIEQLLQGTWVPVRLDQGWVVTDQAYDAAELRLVALRRPPELREVPIDPHAHSMTLTFAGSRYTAVCDGRVHGYGEFAVDRRVNPPVLETRGYTVRYRIHHASMSVFTDAAPVQRVRVAVRPGRLRMCVSQEPGGIPGDLRPSPPDIYVVTFARREPVERAAKPGAAADRAGGRRLPG